MAEVTLSELGVQQRHRPRLKKFSQQMIDEHTRMNSELTPLAAQKQIPLPRAPDARAQFCAQSLAGLSGEEFDRCYAKAQLVAHMDAARRLRGRGRARPGPAGQGARRQGRAAHQGTPQDDQADRDEVREGEASKETARGTEP